MLSGHWLVKRHPDQSESQKLYHRRMTGKCGECGRSLGRWVDVETCLPVEVVDMNDDGRSKSPPL